ncbi:TetR/AcrR family transcriptional regulator [Desulfobotulus alkaliphilus]|nr:TetR/AcrR family transcriptional regulator [Desulfobotulus alkaliphilus]
MFFNPVFLVREASISRIDRQDKYQRILRAGITVFARRGVFRATISEIAREAGVADGTIYLYFKNKDDILARFFAGRTEEIFARFRKAIDGADTAREKLFRLVSCHMEAFQEDREMAVVFQAETRKIHAMACQVNDISARYRDLIAEIIEDGQAEGVIRKELYIALVKRFILGAVDEVVNTWVLAEGKYDLVSMAEPLVDLFMRGIGSASAE